MYPDPNGLDRLNSFALVSYIPDPLAGFLDRLRQELVPNCFLRAHVTILPPRPICSTPHKAWQTVRALAPRFSPFKVEITGVNVFPISDVIYLEIGAGRTNLEEMHECMNRHGLEYREPFAYCPHITLAQNLKPDELDELIHVARRRWTEMPHPASFDVEKVVFVQNTRRKDWLDLGESHLGHEESRLIGQLTDLMVG
jgi:2'-5' RNA ligase